MRKKNKKYKEVIFNLIVYMILLFILIYSGIKIYKWYKDKTSNKEIVEHIKKIVAVEDKNKDKNEDKNEYKEEYTIDFNKLKEQNKETVAWIKVNNTNIEYPVVKANNNNFYLNHSFDKSENLAGWIFADYRNKFDNTDKNIIIYGHNMRDGSMFGSLKNILNSDWYENEENTNITLYTENEKCIYKVFSIYKIESEDYYIKTEFSNDNEFEQFVNTIKNRSIKKFDIDVSKEDNILTLSTCANNNRYRIVLHAKKM
ncbi:MAG: class B sortase [Clostridium sp.]